MHQKPIEVDVLEVKRLLDEQAIVLVDCREADEWETARIDGAILLPMSNWQTEAERLSDFADRHVVVHCHHGGRSLRVANWLRENGFPDAQSMRGGIHAWSQHVNSDVPTY